MESRTYPSIQNLFLVLLLRSGELTTQQRQKAIGRSRRSQDLLLVGRRKIGKCPSSAAGEGKKKKEGKKKMFLVATLRENERKTRGQKLAPTPPRVAGQFAGKHWDWEGKAPRVISLLHLSHIKFCHRPPPPANVAIGKQASQAIASDRNKNDARRSSESCKIFYALATLLAWDLGALGQFRCI